jgi:hypothetical protein
MAIPLRDDFDAAGARRPARASSDTNQVRRLLALAAIYDGVSRTEAAATGGVTLQIVRDRVPRFNADRPEGLIGRKAPGQPPRRCDRDRSALKTAIDNGPIREANSKEHFEMSSDEATPSSLRPLLTLEQIELFSGLSASHIRREIRSKDLACLRFGRALRVAEEDYLEYLARHRRGKRLPKPSKRRPK